MYVVRDNHRVPVLTSHLETGSLLCLWTHRNPRVSVSHLAVRFTVCASVSSSRIQTEVLRLAQ